MAGFRRPTPAGEGRRLRAACPLLFVVLAAWAAAAVAEPGADPAADRGTELAARARDLRLSDAPYWNILLHYKPTLAGRKSLVDDPRFFLSFAGPHDPEAEIEATVEGLFQDDVDGTAHPRCRFPLRYQWLLSRLGVDEVSLPAVSCRELDEALARVAPEAAALVFPSAHPNGPASLFGHTLIRMDSALESPLASYAVNYAARPEGRENALAYAVRGTFGALDGYYSVVPYYEKVKEYSDMEQRDVWEYRLNLTPEEARRLALHAWELRGLSSDYYYFSENCSYSILFLLEAARPTVSLTDRRGLWVTPLDTVADVVGAGLVRDARFRASPSRRVRRLASSLDADGRRSALALADGAVSPSEAAARHLPGSRDARVLDLAAELTRIRYTRGDLTEGAYKARFLDILGARSQLAQPLAPLSDDPAPVRPDEGHGTSAAGVGAGVRRGDPFAEVSLKPAYHGLMDPDEGYAPGSQIDFLAARIRYYPEPRSLRLDRLTLIDVASIAERDEFFQPLSWKVRTGLATEAFGHDDGLVFSLGAGSGLAWRTRCLGLTYAFAEAEGRVSGRYRDGFTLGVGLSAGTVRQLTERWKIDAEGRWLYFGVGDDRWEASGLVRQSLRLSRDQAVFADLERTLAADGGATEARLSWGLYF